MARLHRVLPARRRGRPGAALLCALLLSACASLPGRSEVPAAPAAASRAKVAAPLQMEGPRGPLSAAGRERVIAQVEAEGGGAALRRHLAVMAADGRVTLSQGNRARLLVDGPQTFAAMFAAMEAARRTIVFETYILEDDGLAERLAQLLLRKRAAGLAVFVLYDAVGSVTSDDAFFERLRAGGVRVCAFNPLNPVKARERWNPNHRDHRKITVVDGRIAYTGGINVSSVYASGSPTGSRRSAERGWRDTHIEIAGPAAAVLEGLVRDTWAAQRCEGAWPPPPATLAAAGDKVVEVIASGPEGSPAEVYRALLTAIATARSSVHLTMAYFAPGPDFVAALGEAARRGVDVQLVLPSVSDFTPAMHAGRSYYAELLEAGVRIAELREVVLHAKTAVVDGVWSTVGSSNLDWRSMVENNEVNVVVLGEDFAQEMEAMFARDLANSTPIDAQTWAQRPVLQRLKEWLARLAERWL
jgi:cardiolipin synthase